MSRRGTPNVSLVKLATSSTNAFSSSAVPVAVNVNSTVALSSSSVSSSGEEVGSAKSASTRLRIRFESMPSSGKADAYPRAKTDSSAGSVGITWFDMAPAV